jgi:CHAT domain-containing protein/tetratricopeptide (TPR) repeat protein
MLVAARPEAATLQDDAIAATPRAVSVGGRVEGELRPTDDVPGAQAPSATWTVTSATAQRLTILADSDAMDTRLSVEDSSGREVGADDNGGIGDNPRVVIAAKAGDTYRIRVASASPDDFGAYSLQVVAGEPAPPAEKEKVAATLAYYARALEAARARGDAGRRRVGWVLVHRNAVRSVLGLAPTAENLSDAEEALAVAHEVQDRPLETLALLQKGILIHQAGRSQEAIVVLEASLALSRELGDVPGMIRALNGLGIGHKALGEYREAVEVLEHAVALCEKTGERRLMIALLGNLAGTYDQLDELTPAIEYAERGLGLARELKDERRQSIELSIMALLETRHGRYQRAIDEAEEALRISRSIGDRRNEATALQFLAQLYYAVGRSKMAVATEREAVSVQREVGDVRVLCAVLTDLAELEVDLGHDTDSVAHYEEALRLLRSIGDSRDEAVTLDSLGNAYARAGRWDRALEVEQQAVALAAAPGGRRGEAVAQGDLASVYVHFGRYTEAVAAAERSVATFGELGYRDLEWSPRATLGRALAALGQRERARREFEAALALIEDVRTEIGGNMDRAGYLDRASTLFESYVGLLVEQGEVEAALAIAERARARAFLDLLVTRDARRGRKPPTPEASELAAAAPPSVEQIREQARRHQATVVEYFTSAERLFIWVVAPDGRIRMTSTPLGRPRLTAMVDDMRAALGMNIAARDWEGSDTVQPRPFVPGNPDRALRRLHKALIAPIQAWLPRDASQLVTIVPHGPLFLVSFAALTDPEGRYLIERHTLSYTPSMGTLRYTRREPPPGGAAAAARLLLVGNPTMPLLPGRSRRPPPLPGASAEVRAISRLYPAALVTALTGAKADERTVRELAPGYGIIHVATHGFIRDDEALESLLVLAPSPPAAQAAAPEGDDGLLTMREVFGLSLNARLVVLSGCNTGLGRVSGDGVIGLARAFLYAGSASVVASLWRVADVVESPQMVYFYRTLERNGGDTARALRRAQLETIRDLRQQRYKTPAGRPIPALPTFWASFVLIGEPR